MVKVQGHGQSIRRSEAEFHNNAGNGKTLRAKQNRFGFQIFFEATKKKKKKKFHLNSPEKVNGHDVVVFYRESESLIKSWSTWDLARLAPEQANYLDWFVERDEE